MFRSHPRLDGWRENFTACVAKISIVGRIMRTKRDRHGWSDENVEGIQAFIYFLSFMIFRQSSQNAVSDLDYLRPELFFGRRGCVPFLEESVECLLFFPLHCFNMINQLLSREELVSFRAIVVSR